MSRTYRAGTRPSPLALRQVAEILKELRGFYREFSLEVVKIDSFGDRDKTTAISEIEGSDFFTREIDLALLKGEIDFVVHSAKDLPDKLPFGLKIAAITASVSSKDVLISKQSLRVDQLPQGAKIGTSSRRRKEQLRNYRQDFEIVDIRGNIGERLKLLDQAEPINLDAIVIAAAGLIRLGLNKRVTQELPLDIVQPHPLQGSLALVVRSEDQELFDMLRVIDKDNNKISRPLKSLLRRTRDQFNRLSRLN